MRYDENAVRDAVVQLLRGMGEDPDREGLRDTPSRVARAWREMLSGSEVEDTNAILKTSSGKAGFDDVGGYDGLIVVSSIPFVSVCEHHLLPFVGEADVGYLPAENGPCVGLSKIPRLVRAMARRLQVQERLTQQIATVMESATQARGVGVRMTSQHTCMSCRGVGVRAPMTTEVLRGRFMEPQIRAEFWELANRGGRS